LGERCRKPEGVTVVADRELSLPEKSVYTVADTQAIDVAQRTAFSAGTRAQVHVLYLGGRSDRDVGGSDTLGWGTSATSFVVFKDTVDMMGPAVGPRGALEAAVLVHEMGHLLGLVGNGSPATSAHEDPSSPAHCSEDGCVMGSSSTSWGLAT